MSTPQDEAEAMAARRFFWINVARIGGLVIAIAGIAGARSVIEIPYALAVVLAVGGILSFFFGPPLLARHFKDRDRERGE